VCGNENVTKNKGDRVEAAKGGVNISRDAGDSSAAWGWGWWL